MTYLHDAEIVGDFVAEVSEHLDLAADVALAAEQGDQEALAELRRVVHTVKGAAGFVGLDMMSELCHWLEEALLRGLNGDDSAMGPEMFDQFHGATDLLREWLLEVERCCRDKDAFRHDARGPALIEWLRQQAA